MRIRNPNGRFLKALAIGAATVGTLLSACGPANATPSGFSSRAPASTTSSVSANAPVALAFTTEPSVFISGLPLSTPVTVAVKDSGGNTVLTSNAPVTLSITGNTAGAKLSGHTTVTAVNGVAIFTDVSIDLAGTYYTLTAASLGLKSAVSNTFSVGAGTPVALDFVIQPVGGGAGQHFNTQPVVAIEDAHGNVVTDSKATVTLEIQPGTGPKGAILEGGVTAVAANGLASFLDLYIYTMGEYVLIAKSPGLTSVISSAIGIVQPTTASQ